MQTVAVVGIGEDGLDGLRAEARRTVEEAEVLVGGERHQRLLPEHPAQRVVFKRDAVHLAEDVKGLLDDGKRVVVLASGDPVYFGIGPLLVERLGAQRVRIFPNVGAVQLAFARLGLAWQDARVVSAHGRPLELVVNAALSNPRIPLEDHAAAAAHGWQVARTIVGEGQYDVVVLDEILGAVKAGLVPLDELLELVRSKPAELHLVLTGRNAPAELIDVADLVSEIQPIKHPLQKGIKAQRGIEF